MLTCRVSPESCMSFQVLDIPLTVKMRTGIHDKNWNAHKLLPKLRDWGVTMATVRII